MKKVNISCPGKLMLFGDHAVVHNRHCLVTAVDQRLTVTIEKSSDEGITLTAPDVGLNNFAFSLADSDSPDFPKVAKFVAQSISNFSKRHSFSMGLRVSTRSEFGATFGFGSSSAVTVATLKALDEVFETHLSNEDIFQLGYQTVIDIQGVGSGFDLASAIWGNTILFATGGKEIVPLGVSSLPIVVGYTGVKADTATLVKQVNKLKQQYPAFVESVFDQIESIVLEAKPLIVEQEWAEVGQYMNFQQGLLESLGVGSPQLSSLIFAARHAGAFGAKLSGAGGGDCMITVVDDDHRKAVETAIIQAGGTVLSVNLSAPGLKVQSDND